MILYCCLGKVYTAIICIPPFAWLCNQGERKTKRLALTSRRKHKRANCIGSPKNVPCRCMYESITLNGWSLSFKRNPYPQRAVNTLIFPYTKNTVIPAKIPVFQIHSIFILPAYPLNSKIPHFTFFVNIHSKLSFLPAQPAQHYALTPPDSPTNPPPYIPALSKAYKRFLPALYQYHLLFVRTFV